MPILSYLPRIFGGYKRQGEFALQESLVLTDNSLKRSWVDGAHAYYNIGVGMNVKGWNPQVIAKSRNKNERETEMQAHPNNNRIERMNGTLRERVKVTRSWKSMETALAEGQRIHYNLSSHTKR